MRLLASFHPSVCLLFQVGIGWACLECSVTQFIQVVVVVGGSLLYEQQKLRPTTQVHS